MKKLSVITITLNNARGLEKTLSSLTSVLHKPYEIIVIDGKSVDDTNEVIQTYQNQLPITFISEPDSGIYEAMNKGLLRASGDLIHYLNAGDAVAGDPYSEVNNPCLLPVQLVDNDGKKLGYARKTVAGHGYCHQGIIFPANHPAYSPNYPIAADFQLILEVFPNLSALSVVRAGEVRYDLSGVSSENRLQRDKEMISILWHQQRYALCVYFLIYVLCKLMLTQKARRWLLFRSRRV